MLRSDALIVLLLITVVSNGQNISITFNGTGAAAQVESVTATNLRTNQSLTLPGDETLILSVNTGIQELAEQAGNGKVYPNPFPGKAIFTAGIQVPQTIYIRVQDLLGQVVAQTREQILPGENAFELSMNQAGIYLVSLTTQEGTTSHKVLCTGAYEPENQIQYLGAIPVSGETSAQSSLKSFQSGHTLGYAVGDIILFRCRSGIYTTIFANSPTASKSYEVEFSACIDLGGKIYPVVPIGTQTWMAENLAYLPAVSPAATGSETDKYYYVYGYDGSSISAAKALASYNTGGVLYNWQAATEACPAGWHLPGDKEWTLLTDYVGSGAGKRMKSSTGWSGTGNGDNSSGFNAPPGGYRSRVGNFYYFGDYASYWTSTENGGSSAWYRDLSYQEDGVLRNNNSRSNGFSVRCLKGASIVLPEVTTAATITGITKTTAISGGAVTSDGGAAVTARGVCWAPDTDGPTTEHPHSTDGTGNGSFTSNLTGLTGNTRYFVRAYAINSKGTSYGNPVVFRTSPVLPTVTTAAVSSITQTSATCGGIIVKDGGATVTARGVCWSTMTNPTTSDTKTSNGTGTGSFISSLTGLTGNTTYYVRSYATNSAGTSYGSEIRFKTDPVLPSLTTEAVSAISQTTASSGGTVTNDGGASITVRGVCWSTSQNPTDSDSKTTDGAGTGSFTSNLTGLTASTNYYVRAYATNSIGTAYGGQIAFTTRQVVVLPTVATNSITEITQTTATGGGNVTNDGGAVVTARGICWSTTANPTTADTKTSDGTGTGSFTSSLTGLTGNTTFYVRSYATNSAGTRYGNEIIFKTSPVLPIVITTAVSSVTQTTASSGGNITNDGGAPVTSRGICWSTSLNPTISGSKTTDGSGMGSFISNLTGLTANTVYYVRAYATNSAGTVYGEQVPFATLQVSPPIVTTATITDITQTTATGGGNITSDGGAAVTARGICWSTTANPTTADTKTSDGTGTGSFTSSLTGLTGNTTCYVRSYATNSAGTGYGNEVIFKTNPVLPTVTTTAVTSITQTTAATGGNVTDDGGAPVTARGICWSISPNPTVSGGKTTDGSGTGSFTSNLTGLTSNVAHYVRAYATNSAGTAYGEEFAFTTLQNITLPSVTTTAITEVTQTTATGGGNVTSDGGAAVTARGVCWAPETDSPTTEHPHTTDGTGNGLFTSYLTGLSGNTRYFVRAYATNSEGTSYGTPISLNTSPILPTITTTAVSSITQGTASSGGNITDDGGVPVTARGVCWSTTENPTTDNSKTTDGSGTGTFTSNLTGLTVLTTYFVRAYATNSAGTAYGDQVQFTTSEGDKGSVTDSRDGNVYNWVKIGDQTWMTRNLAYLPAVSPSATGSDINKHYYVYGFEKSIVSEAKATTNYSTYGVLYNWPAAMNGATGSNLVPSGVQGVCPDGWHLPSHAEWTVLTDYLGSSAGGKLKEAGALHWALPNTGATNQSGFSALPAGSRYLNGGFGGIGSYASFWTATENVPPYPRNRYLSFDSDLVSLSYGYGRYGYSVRCLRN